ncbi:cytochrome P450 CYP72A219-like isoform X2 [Momordica charantia]|uniref:Cytochrome P450 CYP72A219-like isoform X2 n=1 Tax=Momordica charantia TaxID=3673 RepID=A0A6J1CFU8_MOMCH|nr:cytochrome P450 CYP72A219-like isoform X2 [Momordica charantia]
METWVAATFSICTIIGVWLLVWGWRVVNSIWVRPKKLEKYLRDQGLAGNSYRLLVGDRKDISARMAQAMSKPMNFSHRIFPRVLPFVHQTIQIYGKNSFMWDGLIPSVLIVEPEQVKTALLSDDIRKPKIKPLVKLLADGLVNHEGPKWVKHRKIINPAFHLEKLKDMVPAFSQCCNKMVNKWEKMVSKEGQCELNVMPYLQTVAADMISRTAFGSSYEKGKMIFELQKQLSALVVKSMMITNPILRFFPTKSNDKMVKINKEMKILISSIINERKKDMEAGEAACNDLLGILIESNLNEIRQKHGNNKDAGMSIEDVIEECKLFYLAGQETTATLLVWTMILLSSYSDWQERARAEVLQVFGNREPDFDGLSRLKIVIPTGKYARTCCPKGNKTRTNNSTGWSDGEVTNCFYPTGS